MDAKAKKTTMSERRTQKTKPQKGQPVEIPVPKRKDFESVVKRVARPAKGR